MIFSISMNTYSQIVDGYEYGKKIEIHDENVYGLANHSNFPVLFHFINDDLKNSEYGGDITSIEGWDIIFTTEDCELQLSHQIESYDPVLGDLICWVKIPDLSPSEITTIHMVYSNATISESTENEDVWGNSFRGVYHFDELDDVMDYSTFGNTAENHDVENSTEGKLLGARYYDDFFDYVEIGGEGMDGLNGTVSMWARPELFSIPSRYLYGHTSMPSYDNRIQIYTGHWTVDSNAFNQGFGDSHLLSLEMAYLNIDEWIHVTCSWNSNDFITRMYLNGEEVSAVEFSGLTVFDLADIGNNGSEVHDQGFYGLIDEVHIANSERSAGWIKTAYNNQNEPEVFATLLDELPIDEICGTELEDSTGVGIKQLVDVGLSIYPNPANEYLIVAFNSTDLSEYKIEIINVLGEEMTLENIEVLSENRQAINTSHLSNGIYYIYFLNETELIKKSFVVSH